MRRSFVLLGLSAVAPLGACTAVSDGETQPLDSADTDTAPSYDPSVACTELGLPIRTWADGDGSALLYATASDFTVTTLDGDWNFATEYSGCENYLFIPDEPRQNSGAPTATWDKKKDTKLLIDSLPTNTHVFFLSTQMKEEDRLAALEALAEDVNDQLDAYDADTRAWKEARIHYVTDKAKGAEGWLGETMNSPTWGAGIDREQRIRYIGSFADPERYNSDYGWFEPNISMAANEARYYNFEAEREARLASQGATVVDLLTGETVEDPGWAGQMTYVDVTLPDAATLATFDTLEWDMTMLCVGDGEYGECPAWDYLNWAYLCDADNPESCTTEVGRWITTYHREGRWVHDITPVLGLIGEGGTRRFAFYSQQPYQTYAALRFSTQGIGDAPDEVISLYSGGYISSTYNDRELVTVDIPEDVTRVGLAFVQSGHGNPGCMEFCSSEHTITVNGNDNSFISELGDQTYGCMDQIEQGTVPNQYGTWWYGRNGWCPGKEVPMDVIDVTSQVMLGETNTFDYTFTNLGGSLESGGNELVTAWLVYYR